METEQELTCPSPEYIELMPGVFKEKISEDELTVLSADPEVEAAMENVHHWMQARLQEDFRSVKKEWAVYSPQDFSKYCRYTVTCLREMALKKHAGNESQAAMDYLVSAYKLTQAEANLYPLEKATFSEIDLLLAVLHKKEIFETALKILESMPDDADEVDTGNLRKLFNLDLNFNDLLRFQKENDNQRWIREAATQYLKKKEAGTASNLDRWLAERTTELIEKSIDETYKKLTEIYKMESAPAENLRLMDTAMKRDDSFFAGNAGKLIIFLGKCFIYPPHKWMAHTDGFIVGMNLWSPNYENMGGNFLELDRLKIVLMERTQTEYRH